MYSEIGGFMAKNFYAVRSGRETGIFKTWNECKRYITGFKGAEYKGFMTLEEAEEYMGNASVSADDFDLYSIPEGSAAAYVDGSYNVKTKVFGYGAIIFCNGETHEAYESFNDESLASMRNVAGEIYGSRYAMKYCVENGISELYIFYDYAGIEKWCKGEWKCNKEGTAAYRDYYLSVKDKLKVTFVKVKGHSGDKYNDMADALAKKAVGIGK